MIDNFALLGQARRPWLDVEILKGSFLALSSQVHPDRVHSVSGADTQAASVRFAELNAAYQCLREPRIRLQHLLELERGSKPGGIERTPAEAMELFMQVGQLCREVDGFLDEREKTASPLLKARLFERGMEWADKLNQLQRVLGARQTELDARLKAMNREWQAAPAIGSSERPAALALEALEGVYRELSYLSKWTAQLRECVVQLSL